MPTDTDEQTKLTLKEFVTATLAQLFSQAEAEPSASEFTLTASFSRCRVSFLLDTNYQAFRSEMYRGAQEKGLHLSHIAGPTLTFVRKAITSPAANR